MVAMETSEMAAHPPPTERDERSLAVLVHAVEGQCLLHVAPVDEAVSGAR